MCRRFLKTMKYYNKIHQPRRPTKKEFDELHYFELNKIQKKHHKGDDNDEVYLDYLLDTASIVVFNNYQTIYTSPKQYSGKLMVVVWSLRRLSEYVWINGKLVEVTEENRAEIV